MENFIGRAKLRVELLNEMLNDLLFSNTIYLSLDDTTHNGLLERKLSVSNKDPHQNPQERINILMVEIAYPIENNTRPTKVTLSPLQCMVSENGYFGYIKDIANADTIDISEYKQKTGTFIESFLYTPKGKNNLLSYFLLQNKFDKRIFSEFRKNFGDFLRKPILDERKTIIFNGLHNIVNNIHPLSEQQANVETPFETTRRTNIIPAQEVLVQENILNTKDTNETVLNPNTSNSQEEQQKIIEPQTGNIMTNPKEETENETQTPPEEVPSKEELYGKKKKKQTQLPAYLLQADEYKPGNE